MPAAVPVPVPGGLDVPPELADPSAAVWHDQRTYHRYMTDRGWRLPPAERMGMATAPSNRRQAAAAGWALDNDIVVTYGSPQNRHADLHRLRAWGLIG